MKAFFQVQDVATVHALAGQLAPLPPEEVPLDLALGRALAIPLTAPSDLPGFTRATMDGYAVRAMDTFGAGEVSPGYLEIVGEVRMGQAPAFSVGPGQCARIGTGGMLPAGADAVVMVEHTRLLDDTSLEVATSVAPGGNTLGPTDDAAQGQELLPQGQCLRPQDLGLLAALGRDMVSVARRPRVGIVSTGDEVVPVSAEPAPGQVRDVNTHTLAAQVLRAGGEPLPLGLVPDNAQALREATARSLESCDLTLLSGGSSVGVRDFTSEVFLSFAGAELLVHGVAVSPGKPFLWVRTPTGHLLGLPGQVASCLVAFYLLVEPILERLQGRPALPFARFARLPAVLTRNIPSAPGREEYLRVALSQENGQWLAQPLFGKSGLLTTMIQGQGLVRVPKDCEGLDAAEAVEVLLFPN
ncbi:MAG: molybdopterin molybdotransferase MoeA [Desulfarculus sp.]|nr:molybdopterin molybdotransferase MoeA [Pseudomonadota bacterium]MBV1715652.1 molybdopterin molybdotransferase MoeA [Desulfarculus sp.]MBU4575679.1 molybdopterin molybdotransferase MoeA [Pseudomonadota bacterium]MBU4600104.1 molybdopterin molybdotransferase MoeA [Pseudomonadota bacterium]MBV1738816.1 molybdopterin molybdotransferase MoeA [Desulfarculus sp.]